MTMVPTGQEFEYDHRVPPFLPSVPVTVITTSVLRNPEWIRMEREWPRKCRRLLSAETKETYSRLFNTRQTTMEIAYISKKKDALFKLIYNSMFNDGAVKPLNLWLIVQGDRQVYRLKMLYVIRTYREQRGSGWFNPEMLYRIEFMFEGCMKI